MGRFAADHQIPALRGIRKLDRGKVLRMLAERAAWLEKKIERQTLAQAPSGLYVSELAAIVQAAEAIEATK